MTSEKDTPMSLHKSSFDEKAEIAKHIDIAHDPADDPEWRTRERRLVRRLDMTLMPVVWILYLFNYLDRNNIACVPLKVKIFELLTVFVVKQDSTLLRRTLD